jgi:hypothetical protein
MIAACPQLMDGIWLASVESTQANFGFWGIVSEHFPWIGSMSCVDEHNMGFASDRLSFLILSLAVFLNLIVALP